MAPEGICPPKFIPIMPCMFGCMTGTSGKPCCCCCCCCCMGTMPAETCTQLWCTVNMKKNNAFNYYVKYKRKLNLRCTEENFIEVWSLGEKKPPESGHDSVLQINFWRERKKNMGSATTKSVLLVSTVTAWSKTRGKWKSICLFSQMLCKLTARAEQPDPTAASRWLPC